MPIEGCGKTLGHGESCVAGYLCGACQKEVNLMADVRDEIAFANIKLIDEFADAEYWHGYRDAMKLIRNMIGELP